MPRQSSPRTCHRRGDRSAAIGQFQWLVVRLTISHGRIWQSQSVPVLRVAKAIANTASRRISEKQGMRVVGVEDRDYVCGRLPAEIWEITADEWRARR